MRSRGWIVSGIAAALLFGAIVVAGATTLGCGQAGLGQVLLDSGPITGAREEVEGRDIWTFKGVPYAAPPVGELRWQAPRPVASWAEPRECTTYGPSCPQGGRSEGSMVDYLRVGTTSEDCLYLNVWSPAASPDDRLPVMVWIHGGSLESGAGPRAGPEGAERPQFSV